MSPFQLRVISAKITEIDFVFIKKRDSKTTLKVEKVNLRGGLKRQFLLQQAQSACEVSMKAA